MRIAVVGTGRIANVYRGAAEQIALTPDEPQIELIGGYDKAGNQVDGIEPVASLQALVDLEPEAFIISTGTTAHLDAYRELATLAPDARVWFEKPVVYTPAQLADATDVFADPLRRTMYHAADAPEVTWAASRWPDWLAEHGAVTSVRAFFSDPYSTMDTSSYVNSWLDSGVNAMSVLQRLVGLTGRAELTDHGDEIGAWTGAIEMDGVDGGGDARITTQWKVAMAAKHSEFVFGDDTRLNLDHQAVAGRISDHRGPFELFGSHATVPRMVQHYVNVFRRLLADRQLFTPEQEVQIHQALTTSAS
jgi:hypothetical protein